MVERILATLKDMTPQPDAARVAPVPAAAAAAPRQAKIVEVLKLAVLTKDFNPVEFRSWKTKFRSYYYASRLDLLALEDQQAMWRICVDPNMETRIADNITPTTTIFGQDSCMQLLTEDFDSKYPLARGSRPTRCPLHRRLRRALERPAL